MSYTKTALLPVGPDEAFALITEPERLRRWMTVSATVDLRAGGGYRWTVTPGHVAAGTFKEVEPGKRIVFGWGWESDSGLDPDGSTVTVTVEPADGGTLVTLLHEGLTEELAKRHAEGWEHFFERLVRVATTGDAGPDEWAYAPENLTPATAADAALAVIQPVLRGMKAEDREKPTPCPDFSCHELAEHLMSSIAELGAMAGATVARPEDASLEDTVSTMATQAIDAWRTVDLDGTVPGPRGGELPASFAAGILPLELLVHGWDLARTSGQRLHVSDEVVAYIRGLAEVVVPAARPNGSFGPEVEAGAGASPIDQLAAYAGRTPAAA
ncbi:TIGR03086 family metal-binding protein [Nocardioides speluncae]|uniref:TIGR03086 family metal-binding protein n=1 Tax=Nocardioides speluncae TaxID=2670337 RepID=UPI000D6889A8|nr:TIGR03086 family metal-binding protein [Nocardioides speluncae]